MRSLALIVGQDSFRISRRIREILESWKISYDPKDLSPLDASIFIPESLLERLQGRSLFGPHFFIVSGVYGLIGSYPPLEERIITLLRHAEDLHFIFIEQEPPPQKSPLLSFIRSEGLFEHQRNVGYGELHRWIRDEVKARGCSIAPDAAYFLATIVGDNFWRLHHEIEKLTLYCENASIRKSDIQLLSTLPGESDIFAFVDALSDKNEPLSLQTLGLLERTGYPVGQIISMIGRQLRLLISALWLGPGVSVQTLSSKLSLHPYAAKKLYSHLSPQRFDLHSLSDLQWKLAELDYSIKTGVVEPYPALGMFIHHMCQVPI